VSRPAGSGEQPESHARGGNIRPYQVREGAEREVSEVKLKKGEPVDRALRRLKKKVDRENTLRDVRMKRTYEKPSEKKRRKLKVSRFSAMLAARYADQ
jgi:small subunit ribosomal protein S21